jgi:hypothetical protein
MALARNQDKVRLAHPTIPKEVDRYLVPTEQVIFILNRHYMSLAKETGFVALGLLALLVAQVVTRWNLPWWIALPALLWIGGYGLDEWFKHHRELFIATDKRVMLVHGLWTRKVAMMPLAKVTDMRYDRTPVGSFFGYGTFIMESAGQVQALSKISYVPKPDTMYRAINTVLFSPASRRIGDRPPPMGSALPLQEPNDMWWKKR